MTKTQKAQILYFRTEGISYNAIAERLGISVNTVKSFCRRNGLGGIATKEPVKVCRQCGAPLPVTNYKPKKFCSDSCRHTWWNAHPELIDKKAYYTLTCQHCGREFQSYGNDGRKYCCHACYITARFGTERKFMKKGEAQHGEKNQKN